MKTLRHPMASYIRPGAEITPMCAGCGSGIVAHSILRAIDRLGILASGGVIVAETSRQAPLTEIFKTVEVIDERKYGDTLVYFLAHKEGEDG